MSTNLQSSIQSALKAIAPLSSVERPVTDTACHTRLQAIPEKSPDLLDVILEEGKV